MLPYSDQLCVEKLGRIFDNKSECYKLFWFQAIMSKVTARITTMTFDELIDEMIADAWYMVSEYHLNLGPKDNLEAAVNYISQTTGMQPTIKRQEILDYLHDSKDARVTEYKNILAQNVPYRLQSSFMATDAVF